MKTQLRLAELLCARLCHELSSPMGTLAGVLEMAAESGSNAAEARVVAEEAATAVRARLRLLRAAWSGDGPAMPADELRGLVGGLRINRRTLVNVDQLQGDLPGPAARLVLNLLLLGVEALAGQGALTVSGSLRTGIAVTLEATRGNWPPVFLEGLADEETAWNGATEPKTVQAALTAILAHGETVRLTAEPNAHGPAKLKLISL